MAAVASASVNEQPCGNEQMNTSIPSRLSASSSQIPPDGLTRNELRATLSSEDIQTRESKSSLPSKGSTRKTERAALPASVDERNEDENENISSGIRQSEIDDFSSQTSYQPVSIPGLESSQPSDSHIPFGPLSIDFQRRLQILAVLWHGLTIVVMPGSFFLLCGIPVLWPLLLPYAVWLLFSDEGRSGSLWRRSRLLRSLPIWSLFATYFPARLHRSQELPPTRKYVFGYHPHGIISHGAWAAFVTDACGFSRLFPGITNTLLTLDSNFRLPFYRDYALAMGLASVARESCERLLGRGGINGEGMGRAVTIVVGGARESLDAQPHAMTLVLRRRKGFVKLALRAGADLVPVLGFGENELYQQVTVTSHPGLHHAQLVIKRLLGFTIPLFHARGVFNRDAGLLPYRRPLDVVVGRPIKVMQCANPDERLVDETHAQYVAELEHLWIRWKDVFARNSPAEMKIVE